MLSIEYCVNFQGQEKKKKYGLLVVYPVLFRNIDFVPHKQSLENNNKEEYLSWSFIGLSNFAGLGVATAQHRTL